MRDSKVESGKKEVGGLEDFYVTSLDKVRFMNHIWGAGRGMRFKKEPKRTLLWTF